MAAQVARNSMPRRAADACTDFLNRRHQRKRQEHRPSDAEPELRAGLGVGSDPGRIVVGGACDESGAKLAHHARHAGEGAAAPFLCRDRHVLTASGRAARHSARCLSLSPRGRITRIAGEARPSRSLARACGHRQNAALPLKVAFGGPLRRSCRAGFGAVRGARQLN